MNLEISNNVNVEKMEKDNKLHKKISAKQWNTSRVNNNHSSKPQKSNIQIYQEQK